MDPQQLFILQHSLGLDAYGQGRGGRSYFVSGEGCADFAHCLALTEAGLMVRRAGNFATNGDDVFYVTDAGREAVRTHSLTPPKLTRSQKRYRRYLSVHDAIGISFGEFMRREKEINEEFRMEKIRIERHEDIVYREWMRVKGLPTCAESHENSCQTNGG